MTITSKDLDEMSAAVVRAIANPTPSPKTWTIRDGAIVGTTGGTPPPSSRPIVTKI